MTHWSGTTVDYIYLQTRMQNIKLARNYAVFTPLSDHLPVVADIAINGE